MQDATSGSLFEAVESAFQSFVYLLLTLAKIDVSYAIEVSIPPSHDALWFYDIERQDGKLYSVLDLLWQEWNSGNIPDTLRFHSAPLSVPPDWLQLVGDQLVAVENLKVVVQVTGHVITVSGKVEHKSLLDAETRQVARSHVGVHFGPVSGRFDVEMITTEEALDQYLDKPGTVTLTIGRFRLPRIRYSALYWPPSERAVRNLWAVFRDMQAGKRPHTQIATLAEVEGLEMQVMWEPVWKEHPFSQRAFRNYAAHNAGLNVSSR